jgi:hypothetical protein
MNRADLRCFTCEEVSHFSKYCPERADHKGKKSKNVNIVTASNVDGYANLFRYFNIHVGGLIHVQIFMYVLTYLCSLLIRSSGIPPLDGEWARASICGVDTVDLKFTSVKIMHLGNMQHVPTIKNLISGSLLCIDGFEVLLESNRVVISKLENLLVKAMSAKACSVFSFLILTKGLRTILVVMLVMIQVFGTLIYVRLILV